MAFSRTEVKEKLINWDKHISSHERDNCKFYLNQFNEHVMKDPDQKEYRVELGLREPTPLEERCLEFHLKNKQFQLVKVHVLGSYSALIIK